MSASADSTPPLDAKGSGNERQSALELFKAQGGDKFIDEDGKLIRPEQEGYARDEGYGLYFAFLTCTYICAWNLGRWELIFREPHADVIRGEDGTVVFLARSGGLLADVVCTVDSDNKLHLVQLNAKIVGGPNLYTGPPTIPHEKLEVLKLVMPVYMPNVEIKEVEEEDKTYLIFF